MATVTTIGSFINTGNPAASINSATTSASSAAGDKLVATLYIPNSNPTAMSLSVGGTPMTEVTGGRQTRSNKTIVTFYADSPGIASGATVSASWTNSGTQNGGGAALVLGTLTPTDTFATGAPELVQILNGLSATPSSGTTGTPSDSAAKYFAFASLGTIWTTSGQTTADNSYTALTEANVTSRTMILNAAAKEFASPPVAAQAETWTTTWGGSKDWAANIVMFREVAAGVPTNTVAPAMTGTAAVGSTLTTGNGSWTNAPSSFTYSWERDIGTSGATWVAISGATSSTYVLTASDIASKIRAKVVAVNGSGSSSAAASNATSTTIPAPPGQNSWRVIAGPIAQTDEQVHNAQTFLPTLPGDLLLVFAACSNAALTDGNGNKSDQGYVFDANGNTWTEISAAEAWANSGATAGIQHSAQVFQTHTTSALAANSTVTLNNHTIGSTPINIVGDDPNAYHGSSPWWYVVAVSTGDSRVLTLDQATCSVDILTTHATPSITTTNNDAIVFGFSASTCASLAGAGWWTPAAGFTEFVDTASADASGGESQYQIAGQVKTTTTGFSGTSGGTTGSNRAVSNVVVAFSAPSSGTTFTKSGSGGFEVCGNATVNFIPPSGSPPSNTAAPIVSGSTTTGSTVSTTNGSWSNVPTGFSYQWQSDTAGNGVYSNISGATASSYSLTSGELTDNVRCVVTASNAFGSASANSNAVGPVTAGTTGTPTKGGRRRFFRRR